MTRPTGSLRRLAVVVAAVVIGSLAPITPPGGGAAFAYPGTTVKLEGHGWGHGRGLGQYGSLGYAIDHGWNHSRILDHFYGGSAAGSIATDRTIRVRLIAFDDRDTVVTGAAGVKVGGVGTYPALLVRQTGSNSFAVYSANSCGGSWTLRKQAVGGPVKIKPAAGGAANFIQTCSSGDNRWYRGEIWATRDSEGPQRTVNYVFLEEYLRGVVPRESPASWGTAGGGKGMHALRAQAVAARSYAAAESRYTYADTCDTTACQVYGGYRVGGTVLEHANTNQAIADTAGQVRTKNGAVARTEFSSSTGGWTTGTSFTNVRDDGDDTASNPNHDWTTSVGVSTIESRYPSIGVLQNVVVTKRNGKGDWGGRVVEVVVRGSKGNVTLSGNEFRSAFGLKSDWFNVVNSPSGGVSGYYVADGGGGIFTFGDARFRGSIPGMRLAGHQIGRADVVGMAVTPSGNGYYAFDSVGGVFTFGDAGFHGSIPGMRLAGHQIGRANVVGMAVTPKGSGYYAADDVGGVFTFGDAGFHGSIPGMRLAGHKIGRADVAGIELTPSGDGYMLFDDVGGVFTFGKAKFYGSIPGMRLAGHQIGRAEVVDMAVTPSGKGYIQLDSNGGVFTFGDAGYRGSLPGMGIKARAVAIALTVTGKGYLILSDQGDVYSFGDAPTFGSVRDIRPGTPPLTTDLVVVRRP